ncbi:MAG TPA: iron-sulfur cluster assembly accessory protein [Blastocatellia bacterium]|nr:iron-sulfur cluster assembly accessory protein [Blastocatellia bacterium]
MEATLSTVQLSLTDAAAAEVRKFMEAEGLTPEQGGLRVRVVPGGCSGFQYGMNLEEAPAANDEIIEAGGLRLFVDMFSAQYLNGVTIDYVTSVMGSGFTFTNPNATGGCGCGSSFSA